MKELIVHNSSEGTNTLIADLCVHGTWEPRTEALFDIRVVDTDAQSYHAHTPHDVLSTAEGEKKHKYLQACQDWRATFTPVCVSVDGRLGSEAEFFVKRMSDFLAAKWERPSFSYNNNNNNNNLPMAFPPTGIETILKFCVGSIPDWHLQFCMPQVYV